MSILTTDRLIITKWQAGDWQRLYAIMSDAEVMRYVGPYRPITQKEARTFIDEKVQEQCRQEPTTWSVRRKQSDDLVGYCGYSTRTYGEYLGETEIGWLLSRQYWNRGLMTEAASTVLRYGFEAYNLDTVIASARPQNLGSLNVIKKIGMKSIGDSENPLGMPVPHFRMDRPHARKVVR